MKFHKKVFMSQKMSWRREEIIEAIRMKKLNFALHVITVPPGSHQLEIFPIGLNSQPSFYVEEHIIVGVAGSRSESLQLMEQLSQVVYEEQGNLDFREYFKE